MQSDFRKSTVARIGRRYPRFAPVGTDAGPAPLRAPRRFHFTAAIVALVCVAGLIGWLRLR